MNIIIVNNQIYAIDDQGHLSLRHEDDTILTELTDEQWLGVIMHFLREYAITEDESLDIATEIVSKAFRYGVPEIQNIENYLADYMRRE